LAAGLPAASHTHHPHKESNMGDNKEVLVVASKVKAYIRSKSEMNTSSGVLDVLSDKIREMCDRAIENANRDGRKTVKDRDIV
jgi:histone H3/H4